MRRITFTWPGNTYTEVAAAADPESAVRRRIPTIPDDAEVTIEDEPQPSSVEPGFVTFPPEPDEADAEVAP